MSETLIVLLSVCMASVLLGAVVGWMLGASSKPYAPPPPGFTRKTFLVKDDPCD